MLIEEFAESTKFVAAMVKLVEVEVGPWFQVIFDERQRGRRRRVKVCIEHDDQSFVLGPLVMPYRRCVCCGGELSSSREPRSGAVPQ